MNVLIMGCGRLGARVATMLDSAGHTVTVLDTNPASFRRLPDSFRGSRAIGNGMDTGALERAGIGSADAFMAITQGDNRNYFASQLAREIIMCHASSAGSTTRCARRSFVSWAWRRSARRAWARR
jgi:trk system potassium uptake protein TrkA